MKARTAAYRRSMTVILCLFAYTSVLANFAFPVLRLTSAVGNLAIVAAAQSLLIPLLAWIARHLRTRGHALSSPVVVTSALLALVGYLFAILLLLFLRPPVAPFSEPFAALSTQQGRVVAYPTFSGGVVFRQQCGIAPGILAVRDLGWDHPASDVRLFADGEAVRAFVPGDPSRRPTTHRLGLTRLPCQSIAG